MDELKIELHDKQYASMPEGASHDESQCAICIFKNENANELEPDGRGDMEKDFTKDEVDAAVKEALTPLQAENDRLKAELADSALQARTEEIQTEADAKVADAEAQRDLAEAAEASARAELDELKTFLEQVAADEAETARIESVKAERADRVKSATNFSDEKIEERIGDWAKLSDEDFDARLTEWAELTASVKTVETPAADVASAAPVITSVRPDTSNAEPSVVGIRKYRDLANNLAGKSA